MIFGQSITRLNLIISKEFLTYFFLYARIIIQSQTILHFDPSGKSTGVGVFFYCVCEWSSRLERGTNRFRLVSSCSAYRSCVCVLHICDSSLLRPLSCLRVLISCALVRFYPFLIRVCAVLCSMRRLHQSPSVDRNSRSASSTSW